MPFILPTLLSFQGSTHLFGVGSFSNINGFTHIQDAIDEIIRVDSDPEAYEKYLMEPVFADGFEDPRLGLEVFLKMIFGLPEVLPVINKQKSRVT